MKKKSHRKDVILARIIFAAFCLIVIAAIAGIVWYVREHRGSKKPDTEESQVSQETQQEEPSEDTQDTEPIPATEPTEIASPNPIVKTTTGVNLRKEPNTSCEVLTVLAEGTQLEVLGEEDGWANVEYQGRIGYVSMDYLEEVPQETEDSQSE